MHRSKSYSWEDYGFGEMNNNIGNVKESFQQFFFIRFQCSEDRLLNMSALLVSLASDLDHVLNKYDYFCVLHFVCF